MDYLCHTCNQKQASGRVSRRAECPTCSADLHVCLNCMNYSDESQNSCKEPEAERVLRKDKNNFCNYFIFQPSPTPAASMLGHIAHDAENRGENQ